MRDLLVARRGAGYVSVRDFWLRSGLARIDIEKLADADCFRSIGLNRREALWAVRALDAKNAAENLPLFDLADRADLQVEPEVTLPAMLPGEEVIEDYRALSLSLKAHPVEFLRTEFTAMGIVRNVDLLTVPSGRKLIIAGLVLVRQRPGSAKGVVFMTLEDETGVSNAIVWPKIFEKYRSIAMGARLVKIHGRLQSANGVIHVVADHLEDLTPALGILQREARRFGASERADEALRPTADHRQKKLALQLERLAREKAVKRDVPDLADVSGTASVMPRVGTSIENTRHSRRCDTFTTSCGSQHQNLS